MKLILLSVFLGVLLALPVHAQDRTISGSVTSSEDDVPLPGVNVVVKGTTTGTVTDANGSYTLRVPAAGTTLIFSFIGFLSQEIDIGSRESISVKMAPDIKELSEIVVTAIGVERSEKSIGYAATQVNSKELTQGRAVNPMASLQGKVAGVNISTASGAPGASTKVIIRGYSSIEGNNNPLYVVDGVPINNAANSNLHDATNVDINRTQDYGNRANDINPDDIESITVLKGASATALYGSRAANGVIMITTKKGNADELRVDITSSVTFSQPLRVPQFQNTFGQGWSGIYASEENGSWGPKMDGEMRFWGNTVDNSRLIKPFSPVKDNLRDFYETGTSYMNSIGISGGNDKGTYYISYGNVKEDGIIPSDADSYDRNTLSVRGSTRGSKLSTSSGINYVNKKANIVTTGQGSDAATVFQEIIQVPRDISIVDLKDINNKFNNLDNYFTKYAQNPYYPVLKNGNDYNEDRVYGNFSVTYAFNDWLNATLRVGGDVSNAQVKDWIAIARTSPTSPNFDVTQIAGRVDERSRFASELNGDFLITASNSLGESIKLNSLVGFNINDRKTNNFHAYVTELGIDDFYNLSNSPNPPASTRVASHRRLLGVYGQVEASYNDYLFVNLQARNDWSSTLPPGANSFFYPGANVSFVFTEAMNISGPLSFGKIRASIGQTGNDADPYDVYSIATPGSVSLPHGDIIFPLSGVNAYEVYNELGNLNLQPEITTEYEFGADLRFFNGRLNVDATYYNGLTRGQILKVDIPFTSGYSRRISNIGKVRNSGIELLISGIPVRTGNFSWELSANYTKNVSRVEELMDGLEKVTLNEIYDLNYVAKVGKPLGMIQGYDVERDPQGRVVVNEADGFPKIVPDKIDFGSTVPDFTLGISNTFTYKGVGLSLLFDYRHGAWMYSYTRHLNFFVGNATQTLYNDRQPFVIPNSVIDVGDDDQGNPIYVENSTPIDMENTNSYWYHSQNPSRSRDFLVEKTFLKLREVVIGYDIPKHILSKTPISALNVSVVGRNLWLWTPKGNNQIDPEASNFGNDLMSELGEFAVGPTVRSMGFSIKATF